MDAQPSSPASGPRGLGLDTRRTWAALGLVALLLGLAAAILVAGLHHTRSISEAYFLSVVNQLEAISELKKSELVQWRKERLGNAKALRGNAWFQALAAQALRNPQDKAAVEGAHRWLKHIHSSYIEYDSLCLIDAAGRRVVSTSHEDMPVSRWFLAMLREGGEDPGVRFLDFYRSEHDGQIYCATAFPIFEGGPGGKVLGYAVLHIQADTLIYPLISRWPISSQTGETYIVRRDGDTVRYLSPLRTRDNSRLTFTMPIGSTEVMAVQAVLGRHGVVRGLDSRGDAVVAALTTLPDGSWSMVTRISEAEVEQGISERVRSVNYLVAALALSMLVGSLVIWKLHRSVVLRNALAAENRLNQTRARFGTLAETMAQGLVRLDAQGAVAYANPHFLKMLGRPEEEVLGHDVARFMLDPSGRGALCALTGDCDAALADGLEIVWVGGDAGKVFSVVTPVSRHAQGEPAERWLLVQDTTRRRLLESQLMHSQKLEAIGQLAAGIAHEINTPAQYVGNNVQFIKGAFESMLSVCAKVHGLIDAAKPTEAAGDAARELEETMAEHDIDYLAGEVPGAIAQTLEGVERISTIVRSVKQFAHPGETAMAPADLNESMKSTATVSRNEWKYVADLETDLDEDLPLVVCMIGEINQVVLNLIVNAAHAIAEAQKADPERRGLITLATRRQGPWAEIRVSDTGTGIPEGAQAKIFDPFFTTKEVGRGTGQGLTISRSIVVEKHKGQLFFETEQGRGTTFVVRLPLTQAEE